MSVLARVFSCALLAALPLAASADPPVPGTRGAVTAEPLLPPPQGTPCVVALYTDEVFNNFDLHDFDYAPPPNCPGPYSKIVLRADFSVTTGRQFDRTANLWIGGVNLYFGTTQEPSAAVAPTWRIERDVSDYVSLLATASRGKIDLGNVVNDTYTGILHGSAQLLFYPDVANWPDRPRRPDRVFALAGGELGGVTDLNGSDARFSRTLTLPTNTERVFLDVVAEAQLNDEFWMTCVPDDLADALQSCNHTAFRETQVRIDDELAGIAPIYPWLYTGAIDPSVWRPIPGVQTLAFEPWRVDLSPFAAKLNDGQPHTVSLSVFNAGDHFSMAANLLVYLDSASTRVRGALTSNTLAATASPTVVHDGMSVDVVANRSHTIAGYVDTSRGRIETTIQQTIAFSSEQDFDISDTVFKQHITQGTDVSTTTRVKQGGATAVLHEARHFPLALNIDFAQLEVGAQQTVTAKQGMHRAIETGFEGYAMRTATIDNTIDNADTLLLNADGTLAGRQGWRGNQRYQYKNTYGQCYSREIASADGAITTATDGAGCQGGSNYLSWFDEFYNYASSVFDATVPVLHQ